MSPATRSNTSSSRQASAVSNAPSLIEGHVNKRYPAAFTRWGSTAVEVLHPTLPLPLAIIPIQYLAGCGVNSWAYIYQVIAMVADVGSNAIICQQHTDDAISRTATTAPSAGLYVLKATDDAAVPISRGPANKRGDVRGAPDLDGAESTVSKSSRSSHAQTNFRLLLAVRDKGDCVVTDSMIESTMAAHIVPFSRDDVYAAIYGSSGTLRKMMASSGLTMSPDAHKDFDSYKWSLFVDDDGSLIVHVFVESNLAIYHGKRIIPEDRFKLYSPRDSWLPDPRLLKWHYKQCVQARLRGYSWDMGVNAQGGRDAT